MSFLKTYRSMWLSLRDEVKARLNTPGAGGWKQIAQKQPEEVTNLVIDIVGTNLSKGKCLPVATRAVSDLICGRQHIDDMDVNLILRYLDADN